MILFFCEDKIRLTSQIKIVYSILLPHYKYNFFQSQRFFYIVTTNFEISFICLLIPLLVFSVDFSPS